MGIEGYKPSSEESSSPGKGLPTPEPLGTRKLNELPSVKRIKGEGVQRKVVADKKATWLRDLVLHKIDSSLERRRVPTPEAMRQYTERIKDAYIEHFKSLGVLNNEETIRWPELIEINSDDVNAPRGRHLFDTYYEQYFVDTPKDFDKSDPHYQQINDLMKVRTVAHELYHATGRHSDYVSHGGFFNIGYPKQQGANFISYRDQIERRRGNKKSLSQQPALEEGAAMLAETRMMKSVITKELPEETMIYKSMLSGLSAKFPDTDLDNYSITFLKEEGDHYYFKVGSSYPNSYSLVQYLHEHVPDFEKLFEEMRLRGNRTLGMSELRRRVDERYGVGIWKKLVLATENNATERLEELIAKDNPKTVGLTF